MRLILLFTLFLSSTFTATATDSLQQKINLHFQTTYIYQYKPAFNASYGADHSILKDEEKQNSLTATLYLGVRIWKGGQIYFNPEVAGGSGLSGAFGMAGSTNGETFRVGDPAPSLYIARAYFRQSFSLGNSYDTLQDQPNQLGGASDNRSFSVSAGKFSLGDFFDNNNYSNSPRTQFLNWALMSNPAWDYAANLRGYTVGAIAMLKYDRTSYKLGLAALPEVANGAKLNTKIGIARGINAEINRNYKIKGQEGNIRLLGYYNQTNMGLYSQALTTINSNNRPDVVLTEKNGRTKTGFGINADQKLNNWLALFARVGWNDGKTETWAFTEADRTFSLGLSLNGMKWKRENDNFGAAIVMNGISKEHRNYLAAGGYGFQLGDGKLSYGNEAVTELFYSYKPMNAGIWFSGDYQFALNPGYNEDRGPVNVFSFRLHIEI